MTRRAAAVAGSSTRVVDANVARTITVLRTASTSSHALAPVSCRTRRWAVAGGWQGILTDAAFEAQKARILAS